MKKSYSGKILHVNLTDGTQWVETPDEMIYRTYLGGTALSTYFLLRDLEQGIDPLGPDNLLIFMTSVLNGLPLSGANRYSAAGKSALTGGFGASEAGGYWGPELKMTGFDGLIIHGRAAQPVYLYLYDNTCEIRDADHYWGKLSDEVQEGLEQELDDKRIRVLQVGVAGENGVRFAAMVNQMRHFHGRGGLGAVMGSKNLKAIVVRGRERLTPADSEAAKSVLQWFRETYDHEGDNLHRYGTSGGLITLHLDGILPTHNFRDGAFESAKAVSGQTIADTILANRGTCYACAIACKREVSLPERGVEPKFGGMEYEVIGAVGPLCGVGDLGAIAEASQWINRYVLDGISTGAVIAFAMECYEKGILTRADTGGLELTWGNAEAVLQLIHNIARREGIGDLLAEGVKRAAAQLGPEAEQFALHGKGQELPMHEPRGKTGLSLAYALAPMGADHLESVHDPLYEGFGEFHNFNLLGLLEPVDRLDLGPKKVRAFYYTQLLRKMNDSIGMCHFLDSPGAIDLDKLRDYLNAATGWNMSIFEMIKVAERTITMPRLFNLREGFTAAGDSLPARIFEPLQSGALAGRALNPDEFAQALQLYYQQVGWDEHGVPTPGKLGELGLTWAVEG